MRIFITGATGVIGRRVIPQLAAEGHQITAIGRTLTKRAALEQSGAKAVDVDLFSADQVLNAVRGHDAIINLATAIPSTFRLLRPGAWKENDRIRRNASRNLAEAARAEGVPRLVQESFALIYQDQGEAWIEEEMPFKPAPHTKSVLAAEEAANSFAESGGTGVILRFGLFYGPDSRQTVEMINLARRGWAALPGPAESYISSVSHDDAAAAVVAGLEIPAGIYNVVDDEPLRRREFFSSLAQELDIKTPQLLPAWVQVLMGSVGESVARSLRISNQKLRRTSGWAPNDPSVRVGWKGCLKAIGAR